MGHFYEPAPNTTTAYYQDASDDEYYGKAAKGAKSTDARWQIFKMEYTAGAGSNKDWIIYYPVDASTGKASDQPKFVWDSVDTYDYRELGT